MAIQLSGFKGIAAFGSQQSREEMISTRCVGVKLLASLMLRIMTHSCAYIARPFHNDDHTQVNIYIEEFLERPLCVLVSSTT